jgi:hypothetical protein
MIFHGFNGKKLSLTLQICPSSLFASKRAKKTMLNSNERHRLMARLTRAILPFPAAHKSSGTEIKARIDRR